MNTITQRWSPREVGSDISTVFQYDRDLVNIVDLEPWDIYM